jgi:hypothetical protein
MELSISCLDYIKHSVTQGTSVYNIFVKFEMPKKLTGLIKCVYMKFVLEFV